MGKVKVVIDAKNPFASESFGKVADIRILPTPEILHDSLHDADAVIVRSETRVGPELLEGTHVRFVGTATIGTDHIDLDYLRARNIAFASAPGSNANSVAEYIAAALLLYANIHTITLAGKTMGVVGVGNVGSKVARVGNLLGMRVLLNDPPLQRLSGRKDLLPLNDLLESDFLTLHVPLTYSGEDATHHMVDEQFLSRLRPDAILLNTSRGAVVETGALTRALAGKTLGAAVLDVWENEPDISVDLLSLVAVGTPHIAGYSWDGKINASRMMYEAFARHFGIEQPWPDGIGIPEQLSHVTVNPSQYNTQTLVSRLVRGRYNIQHDDQALRGLLSLPPATRGPAFRRLRADYPVRREFSATSVHVSPPNDPIERLLSGLGFKRA